MTIVVALTVALALSILGYATSVQMLLIARRYEQDYITKASTDLAAIHATVDARVVWQASLATALMGFLLGFALTNTWVVAGILAAVGAIVPLGFLRFLKERHKKRFHEQLPDVISQARTAVACGYTLPMALAMAQRQLPSPAGQELKVVLGHLRLGLPLSETLLRLQQRVPSEDLDLFASAIIMAERAGGQLGAILTNIEQTVRDRLRLQKKLDSMTSSGRLEARIICCAPFLLGASMAFMQPDLMRGFFQHPVGIPLVVVSMIWMTLGYLCIRKILTPEF